MSITGRLIGSWTLVDYLERPVDGSAPRRPLGDHPAGMIIYNPDGYMSAQLARPVADQASTAPEGYFIAYSGPFAVDEQAGTVRHHLGVSLIPALLGSEMVRQVTFADTGTLTLDALEPATLGGVRALASITWRRPPAATGQAGR